jgi:hypothetical protein
VEDEWFVVWLLLHLTQQLPGCTARCWDDDGEFLLIEVGQSCRHRGGLTVVAVGVGVGVSVADAESVWGWTGQAGARGC